MSDFQYNPLHALSQEFNWGDYTVFKRHMQYPRPLLKVLFTNMFRSQNVNMMDYVQKFPLIAAALNKHLWEKRMEPSFKEKLYHVANIPVQYHTPDIFICDKPADQESLNFVIANVQFLANNGKQFYLFGPFAEGPMKAAMTIARACVDKSIKCYCENYPAFLDTIKTWDLEDEKLKRIRTANVLILWAIGGEYSTSFTNTNLESLLNIRTVNNLTTIMVSALTPKEYYSRYGSEPVGIAVGFKGMKIKETLASLLKEIENVV